MDITSVCQQIYFLIASVLRWLDGKKTAIGGLFFVVKDVIVVPYFDKFYGSMPPQLDFWMGVIATLFTLAGVTHMTVKGIQAKRLERARQASLISRN